MEKAKKFRICFGFWIFPADVKPWRQMEPWLKLKNNAQLE